jgi:hypothetical protein
MKHRITTAETLATTLSGAGASRQRGGWGISGR